MTEGSPVRISNVGGLASVPEPKLADARWIIGRGVTSEPPGFQRFLRLSPGFPKAPGLFIAISAARSNSD